MTASASCAESFVGHGMTMLRSGFLSKFRKRSFDQLRWAADARSTFARALRQAFRNIILREVSWQAEYAPRGLRPQNACVITSMMTHADCVTKLRPLRSGKHMGYATSVSRQIRCGRCVGSKGGRKELVQSRRTCAMTCDACRRHRKRCCLMTQFIIISVVFVLARFTPTICVVLCTCTNPGVVCSRTSMCMSVCALMICT